MLESIGIVKFISPNYNVPVTKFENYKTYAFIFAHPDDEIFTAVAIRNLIRAGKNVRMIYLTNGDYVSEALGKVREAELARSTSLLGVEPEHVIMLGFSERPLFDNADDAIRMVIENIKDINPDCIIGHDYEGGHNGHDLVGFCAYLAARKADKDLWVFAAYNGLPNERRWNQFINGKNLDYLLRLDKTDREFKLLVADTHMSQKGYFDSILGSRDADDFLAREILLCGRYY